MDLATVDKLLTTTRSVRKRLDLTLDATTVLDDGASDVLRGNQGLDWFFAGADDGLPDQQPPEQVN